MTKAIENAQRKVEAYNFDIRKQLLEYDDVANDQRKEIYTLRNELMATEDVSARVDAIRADVVNEVIDAFIPPESLDELWDVPGLEAALENEFAAKLPVARWLDEEDELHEEPCARASSMKLSRDTGQGGVRRPGGDTALREGGHAPRSSTSAGRSISRRWTTCARASGCGATPRRTRSRNTSAKRSRCSRR